MLWYLFTRTEIFQTDFQKKTITKYFDACSTRKKETLASKYGFRDRKVKQEMLLGVECEIAMKQDGLDSALTRDMKFVS